MRLFSDHIMRRAERHALKLAKRFNKDEDGATAIEFAVQPRDNTKTGNDAIPQTENGDYPTDVVGGDILVVRAVLHYRLALPPLLTRLDDPKGSGARTMVATTAFRNEPFPTSGTCDPNTQNKITAGTPS